MANIQLHKVYPLCGGGEGIVEFKLREPNGSGYPLYGQVRLNADRPWQSAAWTLNGRGLRRATDLVIAPVYFWRAISWNTASIWYPTIDECKLVHNQSVIGYIRGEANESGGIDINKPIKWFYPDEI